MPSATARSGSGRPGGCLPSHTRAAASGSQDGECHRRDVQVAARKGQERPAGHPDGRDEEGANAAFDLFVETCGVKCGRAVNKLLKDRDVLLTFYDFPADHWKHIRTMNPIESVFAAVRNRTRRTKGCLNRKTALAMVFRLMTSARKKWRKISGPNRLPEVMGGLSSRTGSSNFAPPPVNAVTNFRA